MPKGRSLARQRRAEVEMVNWQELKKVTPKGSRDPGSDPASDAQTRMLRGHLGAACTHPSHSGLAKHSVATKYGLSLLECSHNGLIKTETRKESQGR